jgi:Tat protein translocase TatB subunit
VFGIGGSEILVILVIAMLFLGPDKLPDAAKQISKVVRDLKKHSRVLQQTVENDEHIGGAIRDLKSALRGDEIQPRPPIRKPIDKPVNKIEGDHPTPEQAASCHLRPRGPSRSRCHLSLAKPIATISRARWMRAI